MGGKLGRHGYSHQTINTGFSHANRPSLPYPPKDKVEPYKDDVSCAPLIGIGSILTGLLR
jgi:hypothetical protein